MLRYGEDFFKTQSDPDQIPVSKESLDSVLRLHPSSVQVKVNDAGELVGWATIVPTQREVLSYFLHGKYSEKDLLMLSKYQKKYEALYLCSAFVVPSERGKGYAVSMLLEAIEKIPLQRNPVYGAWLYSNEGVSVVKKAQSALGKTILVKKC